MTEFKFLNYDGISLFSNCLVYQNEKNVQVHLLPVIHIGDTQYYVSLLNYIQNRICIFEKINLTPPDVTQQKFAKSLDEYLEIASPGIDGFWDQYKKLLKKFYKKFLTREVKSLCKTVRKQIKNFDEKIRTIYDDCIKSGFGIQNMYPIQLYLCESLNLNHQIIAIDYINDIPRRTNWIHTDLDFGSITENVDLNELIEEMLTEPSPEILDMLMKQIILLLTNILGMVEFKMTSEISERRELLASELVHFLSQRFEEVINSTPEYILEGRNSMVEEQILKLIEEHEEIVVFYGVAHMGAIERFLLGQGFSLKNQQGFKAFKIEDN
ncbi:MAG: hypothetical protein HWN79_05315 [Candidatus Lokiarchaeota archaeon]|nr:hypothetical protein [Candidatus Lokiarchaeota archaeon]